MIKCDKPRFGFSRLATSSAEVLELTAIDRAHLIMLNAQPLDAATATTLSTNFNLSLTIGRRFWAIFRS